MQSVEPITDLKVFVILLNLQIILWQLYIVLMDCSPVNLCWSKVFLSSYFRIVTYLTSSECKIKIIVKCVTSVFVMLELIPWIQGNREGSLATLIGFVFFLFFFFFNDGIACFFFLFFFIYFAQHVHFINKLKCIARAVLNTRKSLTIRYSGQNAFK